MRSLLALLVGLIACASAFMVPFGGQPAQAVQTCPAPVKTPAPMLLLEDLGLDNPAIAEDEKILPARKCGFCMG